MLGVCAAMLCALPAHADDPFYKNKRLTTLINFAAGGPTDIEGRLFARHIGKHIEGQPSVIVQNMEGAGGLIGNQYVGEVAPKDGTVLGYFTGAAWLYATAPEKHRVDFKTYEFIAYQPGNAVYYVRADVPPGMKEAADIVKAKGVVTGGLSADSSKDLLIRLSLDLLGVPFKYVTGYRSNQSARLALEKSEINLLRGIAAGLSQRGRCPTWCDRGTVIPLYYDPGWNGESFRTPTQIEGLSVLPFHELYQKVKGAPPSGQLSGRLYGELPRDQRAPCSASLVLAAACPAGRRRCPARGGDPELNQRQGLRRRRR